MPLPEETDEKFEGYLRQFRPLAPEPLPGGSHRLIRRRLAVAAMTLAVAVSLIVVWLKLSDQRFALQPPFSSKSWRSSESLTNPRPLTVGRASDLLTRSSSFKEAIDEIAFESRAIQLPKGTHSAVATLSKEKAEL
jgi:hypothetical protein